jgi:hypothetical protein
MLKTGSAAASRDRERTDLEVKLRALDRVEKELRAHLDRLTSEAALLESLGAGREVSAADADRP